MTIFSCADYEMEFAHRKMSVFQQIRKARELTLAELILAPAVEGKQGLSKTTSTLATVAIPPNETLPAGWLFMDVLRGDYGSKFSKL